jgi:ankyrin repeat protein
VVGQLLAAGAAVDWAGSSGKTPLWIAARHGHEAVGVGRPRLLMAVGALALKCSQLPSPPPRTDARIVISAENWV